MSGILEGKIRFGISVLSNEVKDLITKCLHRDPDYRIGKYDTLDIKDHAFFKDVNWEEIEKKNFKPLLSVIKEKI